MKRMVICADGTWNEPEKRDQETGRIYPTNVLKIARAVNPLAKDGTVQVVYYHAGVGTAGGIDKYTGGAFGHGIELNVRSIYRFLVLNYAPGDDVFLFGFSRGAFTVRTVLGFMSCVGLLEKNDEYFTPELFKLYESKEKPGSDKWKHAFRRIKTPRPCPAIHFVGVWDTVGSLGAPGFLGKLNRNKYAYHDVELKPEIRNAYHALAIDERREPFRPTLWHKPENWQGTLQQAWFPGVHSNVGGGYSPDGLANEALHWIAEMAEINGLELNERYLGFFRPCFDSILVDSMSMAYKLMGPEVRVLGAHSSDGECIHQSALDRLQHTASNYGPANLTDCMKTYPSLPIVTTTRVPRTGPCGAMPIAP